MKLPFVKSEDRILQEALERLEAGEPLESVLARYPAQSGRLRALLDAAGWLGGQKEPLAPAQEFLHASRARLVSDLRQRTTPRRRVGRRFTIRMRQAGMAFQTALLVLLAFLLLNIPFQLFQSSRTALPGDRLYPLKRLQEQARLAVNFNPLAEALLHVRFTQQRLVELQEMILDGRVEELDTALVGFQDQLQRAEQAIAAVGRRDPQLAESMHQILEKSIRDQEVIFSFLLPVIPLDLRSGFERALLFPSQ